MANIVYSNPMSLPVYTYYVDVPGLWPVDTQLSLIKVWERSWRRAGWEPVVLTETDAKQHPRFDFFNEHFATKPTKYGEHYTVACFMRWLALANVGGGMMVDYDVINYGFEPRNTSDGFMRIFSNSPPDKIFMGAVQGSAQHYLDMAELFAAWKPDERDWDVAGNQYHLDDLRLLERMFEGTKEKPVWLIRVPGCSLFPHDGWKSSPMTHFAYAMRDAGFWPKHEWIEKIRPIE
jgi:hypothetical protein